MDFWTNKTPHIRTSIISAQTAKSPAQRDQGEVGRGKTSEKAEEI
jgi:hypothetical protein